MIDSVKFILGARYELRKSIIQMIVLIICGRTDVTGCSFPPFIGSALKQDHRYRESTQERETDCLQVTIVGVRNPVDDLNISARVRPL